MENLKTNKTELDNKEDIKRVGTVIFIVLLLIFAFVMITNSFHMDQGIVDTYNYQVNKGVKYEVNLVPNNYIQQNPQGMNELYISNLVKNILLKLDYSYTGTEKANLVYDYYVDAKILGEYNSNEGNGKKRVWNKKYSLVLPQKKNINNSSNVYIHEDLAIDFNKYRTEVKNFTRDIGLSINANLEVVLTVSINGTTESGQKIAEQSNVSTTIPLNQDVFTITTDTGGSGQKAITKNITTADINYLSLSLGLIALIFAIVLVVMLIKKMSKQSKISPYERKIKKIMNEYGDIIVETDSVFNYSDYNVIDIKNFDELLDLEQEIRIPIIVNVDLENKHTVFAVINNSTLYRFILEEEDLD